MCISDFIIFWQRKLQRKCCVVPCVNPISPKQTKSTDGERDRNANAKRHQTNGTFGSLCGMWSINFIHCCFATQIKTKLRARERIAVQSEGERKRQREVLKSIFLQSNAVQCAFTEFFFAFLPSFFRVYLPSSLDVPRKQQKRNKCIPFAIGWIETEQNIEAACC